MIKGEIKSKLTNYQKYCLFTTVRLENFIFHQILAKTFQNFVSDVRANNSNQIIWIEFELNLN